VRVKGAKQKTSGLCVNGRLCFEDGAVLSLSVRVAVTPSTAACTSVCLSVCLSVSVPLYMLSVLPSVDLGKIKQHYCDRRRLTV